MRRNTILFLHGLESSPGGSKATYLEECGYKVLNPTLPKDSFEESVRIAQEIVDRENPAVVVGSSRGGAVAMCLKAAFPPHRLILIAPAWSRYAPASGHKISPSAIILHSIKDEVIPFSDSKTLEKHSGARVINVGNCHRMNDSYALPALGKAVKEATRVQVGDLVSLNAAYSNAGIGKGIVVDVNPYYYFVRWYNSRLYDSTSTIAHIENELEVLSQAR